MPGLPRTLIRAWPENATWIWSQWAAEWGVWCCFYCRTEGVDEAEQGPRDAELSWVERIGFVGVGEGDRLECVDVWDLQEVRKVRKVQPLFKKLALSLRS